METIKHIRPTLIGIGIGILVLYLRKVNRNRQNRLKLMREPDLRKDKTGAEIFIDVLKSHGVNFTFSLCGESISPIIAAAQRGGIKLIDTRQEATGTFAAKAYARLSRRPGIMIVTTGPGLTNTVTAAKDATNENVPIIIISGGVPTICRGIGYLQDMNHIGLMKNVCKDTFSIEHRDSIIPVMKKAFQVACSDLPGAVYVEVPLDVIVPNYKFNPSPYFRSYDTLTSIVSTGWQSCVSMLGGNTRDYGRHSADTDLTPLPVRYPKASKSQIESTVKLLLNAKKPLCVIGSQVTLYPGSMEKLSKAVKGLKIPLYTISDSRGLLGKSHKYLLSQDGKLKDALPESDFVLLAGITCDYYTVMFGLGLPQKESKIISINRSLHLGTLNSGRYWKLTEFVLSDVGYYLIKLSNSLQQINYSSPESWVTLLRKREDDTEAYLKKKSLEKSDIHLNPATLMAEIELSQKDKDIVWVLDQGDFAELGIYFIKPRHPLRWVIPGDFAAVGCSIGYAIGAKMAYPEKEVWMICGDGSCGYTLMDYDTLMRHNLNIVTVVGNDGRWGEVCRKQIATFGTDYSCTLEFTKYEEVVKPFGGIGYYVDETNGSNLVDILKSASTQSREHSVLVNVLIGLTDLRTGDL